MPEMAVYRKILEVLTTFAYYNTSLKEVRLRTRCKIIVTSTGIQNMFLR